MNKINFKTATVFAPLAYAIHHFEENIIFDFRAWRLTYFADNNPLSTEAVFVILSAVTLVFIILHLIFENKATAQTLIIHLMASQAINLIFHAVTSVLFWDFSPGTITGLLVYLPVNLFILSKAIEENWVTKKSAFLLFVIGSSMFALFEMMGPPPMLAFLVFAYGWIFYTVRKNRNIDANKA